MLYWDAGNLIESAHTDTHGDRINHLEIIAAIFLS
jgi:hypothetical protein